MAGKKLNYGETKFTTVEQGLEELRNTVKSRNAMGGAMYWNILNDDCCTIRNELLSIGGNREEIADIIGRGNFR